MLLMLAAIASIAWHRCCKGCLPSSNQSCSPVPRLSSMAPRYATSHLLNRNCRMVPRLTWPKNQRPRMAKFGDGHLRHTNVTFAGYVRIMKKRKPRLRLDIYPSQEFVVAVDRWRETQPGSPSRAEAVRRIVDETLMAGGHYKASRIRTKGAK
jgi:hypothetical protein